MEMELASSSVIDSYVARLNSPSQRRPRTRLRGGLPSGPKRAPRPQRTCVCGGCATCLENSRWERIFNDKFADPNYYGPRPAPLGSSLNAWA
jgi:hypothetical protein